MLIALNLLLIGLVLGINFRCWTSAVLLGPHVSESSGAKKHRVTDASKFPFYVRIVLRTEGTLMCGGVIISPTEILTAAHCLYKISQGGRSLFQPEDLEIVAGCVKPTGYASDELDTTYEDSCQARNVSGFRIHPEFNFKLMTHDIAVLALPEPLTMTNAVAAIALPDKDFIPRGKGTLIGFGCTHPKQAECSNKHLHQVEIPILTGDNCTGVEVHYEKQLCTNSYQIGGCYGDSGSPMIFFAYDNETIIYPVVGAVLSNGADGCDGSIVDTYTIVSKHLDFISQEKQPLIVAKSRFAVGIYIVIGLYISLFLSFLAPYEFIDWLIWGTERCGVCVKKKWAINLAIAGACFILTFVVAFVVTKLFS